MKVFVTGGTGLLGNNVLRQLTEAGHEAIALVRGKPDDRILDGIEVELVSGDLSDASIIDAAVARADAVIHSAGLIHIGWHRHAESMSVNRDGSRTIAQACLRHDRKLVHVGTVNTLAIASKTTVSDETTPLDFAGGQVPCVYVESKRAGVEEVRRLVPKGLRATLVHPAFMLGPWDWKPSSGKMVLEVGKTWRPLCPRGVNSICDCRDVAAATIAAIDEGSDDGRDYILAGHNWSYHQLWTEIAKRTGVRGPLMRAGPAQLAIAGRLGDWCAKWTGRETEINSAAIRIANQFHAYDSSRAVAELGYRIRPIEDTLDDAVAWIQQNHGIG